jgi:hypothetical protein
MRPRKKNWLERDCYMRDNFRKKTSWKVIRPSRNIVRTHMNMNNLEKESSMI